MIRQFGSMMRNYEEEAEKKKYHDTALKSFLQEFNQDILKQIMQTEKYNLLLNPSNMDRRKRNFFRSGCCSLLVMRNDEVGIDRYLNKYKRRRGWLRRDLIEKDSHTKRTGIDCTRVFLEKQFEKLHPFIKPFFIYHQHNRAIVLHVRWIPEDRKWPLNRKQLIQLYLANRFHKKKNINCLMKLPPRIFNHIIDLVMWSWTLRKKVIYEYSRYDF